MFGRSTIFLFIVGAAVVPYVVSQLRGRDTAATPPAMVGQTPLAANHAAPFAYTANAGHGAVPQAAGLAPRTSSKTDAGLTSSSTAVTPRQDTQRFLVATEKRSQNERVQALRQR